MTNLAPYYKKIDAHSPRITIDTTKPADLTQTRVVWTPQKGSQTLALSCPFSEILYEGARGPGKTDWILMRYAARVGVGFGPFWVGIIFRREYKELQDIIRKSKRWFPHIFPGARFLRSASELKWVFPDGEELLFRLIKNEDDYWSYHGHEYPFIGWEELCTWPDSTCYDVMFSCNRSSYVPEEGGDQLPLEVMSTANPYGVGHNWVKARFIDQALPGVPFLSEAGRVAVHIFGHITENKFLDEDYVDTIRNIKDPNKKLAWWNGSWDITAGGMFDEFWRTDIHKVDLFKIPGTWRVYRSFDWGSSKPFSVGWHAISDGSTVEAYGKTFRTVRGDMFRISEWYGCTGKANEGLRMTSKNIAIGILEREELLKTRLNVFEILPGPADSSIYDENDGPSIGTKMEEEGVYFEKANKRPGSRKNGWELLRNLLEAGLPVPAKDNDGEPIEGEYLPREHPSCYIFSTCTHFFRTIPTLPRDPKDMDDVNTEAEDHIADEWRYMALHEFGMIAQEEF